MISSVFVSGRLGASLPKGYRYVEVDRPSPDPDGHYPVDKVIVRSPFGEGAPLMKMPLGSFVCFKGRLEVDREHGLILVDEVDEILRFPKKVTKEEA
jgi:hypothetical protein